MQNENLTSRLYRDEPIRRSPAQMENLPPSKYRELRKIAQRYGLYNAPESRIFYEQGKFMEDFEDDFDFQGEFVRYFPTYQSMNDFQLRGYFSWRTKVRQDVIEKTSLSFAFVYIYELLNKIGISSPEEGFHALKNFWTLYREIDAQIDRYVRVWIKDYIVYNNLDKSFLNDLPDDDSDQAILALLSYRTQGSDEIFTALNSLSSYDLGNSLFFKQYPADVKEVVYGVFSTLSDYYDKKRKNGINEKFFGKFYTGTYSMFQSAVFYHRANRKDFTYEINDICSYRCTNGRWSCKRFFCYKGKIQKIGVLLKTVDFLMRQYYCFKSRLKVDKPLKIYQNIISREIEKQLGRKRNNTLPKIEIDVSRLPYIRKASIETQSKLIVDEPETMPPPDIGNENKTGLDDAERLFMKYLLDGKEYNDFIRSENMMLSVLIDAVNEKLFETFGDTVIAFNDDKPELIEDYIDELKGMFEE